MTLLRGLKPPKEKPPGHQNTGQPTAQRRSTHYDTPVSLRPDEPIRSSERDLLDRAELVDTIAEQILAIDHQEPITIALTAQWGAGKTSFLHLLRNRLRRDVAERASSTPCDGNTAADGIGAPTEGHTAATGPIVVSFNPWLYGNVDDLVREFFTEIGHKLHRNANESIRNLAGDFLTAVNPIVKTLAPWIPPATYDWAVDKLLKQDTIQETKNAINKQLSRLSTRIVVFIDDIDRLEPDVTKLLFRMVRLVANFKNTTYVLAFDRAVVESHLAHGEYEAGREYLAKIIQVNYRIPKPQPDVIRHILRHELDDVRVSIEQQLRRQHEHGAGRTGQHTQHIRRDTDRYERLVHRHFEVHFSTLRNIKRYVNALRLALPPVAGKVDLVDFYVIELIRLFYPELYGNIARAANPLVVDDMGSNDFDTPERGKKLAEQLSTLIPECRDKSTMSPTSESLLSLLYELFPDLKQIERRPAVRARWARDARVCSYASFDRYFILSAPTGDLPKGIEDRLRKALASSELIEGDGIRGCIRSARKRGIVPSLLDAMAARTSDLDAGEAERLAKVVCSLDVRDDLQLSDRHDDHRSLSGLVRRCIAKQANENVEDVISRVIRDGKSLFTVANVFEDIFAAGLAIQGEEQAVGRLKAAVREKIVAATVDEGFWEGRRWWYLLRVASTFVGEAIGDTMTRCAEDEGSLLAFYESFTESLEAEEPGSDSTVLKRDILDWVESAGWVRLTQVGQGDGEYAERANAVLGRLESVRDSTSGNAEVG